MEIINYIIQKSTNKIVETSPSYFECEDIIMYLENIDKQNNVYKWEDYEVIQKEIN